MAAAQPKERLGNQLTKEQVSALKLERLRLVAERFPGSVWAQRAGVLSGVLLVESNPSSAIPFLQTGQRDLPVLDDYLRLWLGEAKLRLGEAREAAGLFESIVQTVPDSNLTGLVALRAGEAWYQAASCPEALGWLAKAVTYSDKDKERLVPQAWLRQAACQLRGGQIAEGRTTLKQLWVKFPYAPEAKEAEGLLLSNLGGEPWAATSEDRFGRAQSFASQALQAEVIEELKKFLTMEPGSPQRGSAKLKLGVAQVRLKQYDHARETFRALVAEHIAESNDATVWLARVYLRQAMGAKLLELSRSLDKLSLSAEQKGQINIFAGIWLEDQKQLNEAVAKYRVVAKSGEPATQRAEASWRVGWALYRMARYKEAAEVWQHILDQRDSDYEPQALYWIARSLTQTQNGRARDVYAQLCRQYPFTYYCQLAREQAPDAVIEIGSSAAPASVVETPTSEVMAPASMKFAEVEQQPTYRRALELKILGLEGDAARELAALTERYTQDPEILMTLSMRLNEVGAYNHALRLARAKFREKLERTGGLVAPGLWAVAYPTGLIPTIKTQNLNGVNPYLVAAIIREESQYDVRAVSRVGAIGLMQVMPATANQVAQRHHLPAVTREDLFDQETNIRIGARYVEQLLGQFSGDVIQTIAAYNAGPIAVGNWAGLHKGRSQDEFVELIPFQETRQYVKRVLRSFKEYLRLAGTALPVS
ncbi:MAG: transglycosylase SLT domain-containing protein [Nitrospira sp.]|nr:transglycosylase SLT domain-containing protein [Nitrospira sp.]